MNIAVENYLSQGPEKVMAKHGKSFFWASQVFSKEMLHNVATLYTFCRYIDDLADECEPKDSRVRLEAVIQELDQGKGPFSNIFGPQKIPTVFARELLDGALFDVNNGEIHSHRDLMIYCYKVAGVVGLMMTQVIGVTNKDAYAFAVDLGMGMQLTNICRDVLEDANNQRSYLPFDKLQFQGLSVERLSQKGETPQELVRVVDEYLALADEYYDSALAGMRYIPLRARFAILLAARLYQGIGHKIRRNNYNVLAGRTFLTKWEKIVVSFVALFEFLFLGFKAKSEHHDKLHNELRGLPGIAIQPSKENA